MNIKEHTTPEKLLLYAFYWSEARLVVAAFSLFFGAVPVVYRLTGMSSSVYSLLALFWLISGIASAYLLYTWYTRGQKVFGGTESKDVIAFFIMVVTGINLGLTAFGNNFGMSLVWGMPISYLIYKATAVVYLIVAYHMWTRFKESGERLFASSEAPKAATPTHTSV